MILKFVCSGSIICIVSIKIRFKANHHLQSLENLCFLLPPLILRLYFNVLASQCSGPGWFESHVVGNPKARFSHVMAHMLWVFFIVNICIFLMFEGPKED